jgi:hypothetical protein
MGALSADDDQLHPPANDDLFWTETHWFAFAVPERKLTAAIYPVIRTNQKIASCSIQVWDDSAEQMHYAPYGRVYWHLPMPTDLRNWDLPCGLSFRCIEPLREWRLTFADGDDIAFDLTFRGIHDAYAPTMAGMDDAMPAGFGHFDQLCHVTGSLSLYGDELAVDCVEMRDKSWSARSDLPRSPDGPKLDGGAYSYGATGPDEGFCVWALGAADTEGPHAVLGGFLWRDGVLSNLVSGKRVRDRDGRGRPARVLIEATDDRGRSFTAEGTCVNNYVHMSTPNGFAWMSGTPWVIDGVPGWGEDQEVWEAGAMRHAVRAGLVKP